MNISNFIAYRYLRSRKETKTISFISYISIIGIVLGVATLIIVTNVLIGFESNLKNKIIGANSHIMVNRLDGNGISDYKAVESKIRKNPEIAGVSPFVFSQVLLTGPSNVSGVMVRGIIPEKEMEAVSIKQFMINGRLESLNTSDNVSKIVLGKDLALQLGVRSGDNVVMISPFGKKGPFGFTPKMKNFTVIGIFDTGMFEYNNALSYISIKAAQEFFELGDVVSGFSIKTNNFDKASDTAKNIQSSLGFPYWAKDWISMNKNLFSALKLEKAAMFVILTLIVVVASFNIISLITMTVKDKKRDIAILKAMGASEKFIQSIFIRQGLIIGTIGTIIGDIIAYLVCYILEHYKIISLPQDVYFMDKIPVKISPEVFVLVTISAIVISYLSALYPAKQAAKLDPIEALRNE